MGSTVSLYRPSKGSYILVKAPLRVLYVKDWTRPRPSPIFHVKYERIWSFNWFIVLVNYLFANLFEPVVGLVFGGFLSLEGYLLTVVVYLGMDSE